MFAPNLKQILDDRRWGIALTAGLLWLSSAWATEPPTNHLQHGVFPATGIDRLEQTCQEAVAAAEQLQDREYQA